MTDESGTVVWSSDYKPFGGVAITTETIKNNFRFPGQYYDQETGLHYNYFRDYHPEIGRDIEPDPIGLKGGINLFVYAGNGPVNSTDPRGLVSDSWWSDWVIIDAPEGYNFTECCQKHDDCYAGKDNQCDKSKEHCDQEFYKCT